MIEGVYLTCRDGHNYIVTETEADEHGWRAHRLCCSKCLQLIFYKDILRAHNQKPILAEIINQDPK